MSSNQQIEQQLVTGLRRIDAPYRQALAILDELSLGEPESRLSMSDHLKVSEKLKPSMQVITDCEEQLAPLRQQWRDLGVQPGPDLAELLTGQTDLLKRLIDRLNIAEKDMTTGRAELGLKLDQSQKHDVARQAYQHESV